MTIGAQLPDHRLVIPNYVGDELEIGFNVNYLLDALAAVDGSPVELGLTDANNSCLLSSSTTPQAKYVVMPVRL